MSVTLLNLLRLSDALSVDLSVLVAKLPRCRMTSGVEGEAPSKAPDPEAAELLGMELTVQIGQWVAAGVGPVEQPRIELLIRVRQWEEVEETLHCLSRLLP